MPPLVRRYFKTSFFFGGLGIMTGMHMASALHLGAGSLHRYYHSAHTHMVLVGFFMMMWMGVLLWKLPAAPANSRYKPGLMTLVYWITTITTIVRYTLEAAIGYIQPEPDSMHMAIFLVSMVQGVAVIAFLVNLLPRVNVEEV